MKRAAVLFVFLFAGLWLAKDVQATIWPGPDLLGYGGSTIAYNFTDISGTGLPLSLGDDEVSGALPVGFTFNFYGIDYTSAYVSSNGFITFSPGLNSGCCEGQNIPEVAGPNNLVAGYWTDLYPSGGGTIHYGTTGLPGSRSFIVQFMNIPLIGGATTATFQIILHEGTNDIEMQFPDSSSNGLQVYVTGIENSDGTAGLQYNFGDYSLSNLGIMISPPVITINTQPAGQTACSGSSVTFTAVAGGDPIPSVQWQVSTDGGSGWSDIPGATLTPLTFTASPSQNGYQYRAVFRSGSRAISNAATLAVTTITVDPPTVPGGTTGLAYPLTQFSSTGGAGTITYAIASGLLPAGMSLTSGGLLSGTPTQTGSFPVTVTATDSGGCAGSRNVNVSIGCMVITVGPSMVSAGSVGSAYPETQFSSTGGAGTITYAITSGLLPAGMSLTSGGLLSGIPTQTGSFPVTVTATDSGGCAGSRNVNVSIGCMVVTIAPSMVSAGSVGSPYSETQFSSTGGAGTVTYAVTGGVLPGGVGLSPAGLLSGTPSQSGSFPITITATDSNGCAGSSGYTLEIGLNNTVAVPTINEWGMVLFMLLAGAAGVYRIVRTGGNRRT